MVAFEHKRVMVTSALPYVHGVPHLGNIVGSLLPADIFHRYLDIKGTENVFICGSDVHGTPLELEANKRDVPVEEFAEQQHEKVGDVLEEFNMDFSIWGSTDSHYNRKQTHEMFVELYLNGYMEKVEQKLPYSEEDGRFLPDRYIEGECPECGGLARGDQCDECGTLLEPKDIIEPYSTISGSKDIEFRETTHLAFDLSRFQDDLKEWLNGAPTPVPENYFSQVENLIEEAEERVITRDIEWGFNVPVEEVNNRIEEGNENVEKLDPEVFGDKTVYVWFDAPIGYIGFTRELFNDEEEWEKYWTDDGTEVYYSIGKDNTIFHTVIWPSMLKGASKTGKEYNLPHYEFIHQYLLAEETKFSKSRGKGLSTEDALEMYPADYWRFYLSTEIPNNQDTKFSWKDFESKINNVLNDTVGNFVNRTLSLTEKWFDSQVPVAELRPEDEEVREEARKILEEYEKSFEDHDLKNGMEKSLELARLGDRYLSDEEPWNNEDRQGPVIHLCLRITRALSVTLYPYMPDKSREIAGMLDLEIHTEEGFNELIDPMTGGLTSGDSLGERELLFEKIDVEEDRAEEEYEKVEEEEKHEKLNTDTVSFEDFKEMDIRVGKVEEVEEHPDADRLYKVQVNVGKTVLQTCAGLVNHYSEEELEGRKVVVLANLEPTELRGEKSECMMLAAEDDGGNVELLETGEMEVGSEVS